MLLRDRVAIVTGSSRGLGAAIARTFAAEGASVVVNGCHHPDAAERVAGEIDEGGGGRAIAVQADVTREEEVRELARKGREAFGPVDVLVNNAMAPYAFDPSQPYASFDTLSWEHVQQQIDVTLKGAMNAVRATRPQMKDAGGGRIVNVGTNLIDAPVVTYYDYNTAKTALLGLTRNLARELGADGITVNMVSGGLIDSTPASESTPRGVFDTIASQTPLGRVATPPDVARAVALFASDWAGFVTGQYITADGGLVMA